MNYPKLITVLIFSAVLIPSVTLASSVVRTGQTVSIENDQKIEGDFYTAASILSVSGEVAEDLVSLAARNTLNGKVGHDALMVGASVDVHGPVGEDLRVIGGNVIIAEPITGDALIVARTVKILSTASVGGDVIIYADVAEISGSVGGNIIGATETLRLDAPVGKGVDITTGQLTLGDRAAVTENVRYISTEELVRAPGTQVGGEVTRSDAVIEVEHSSWYRQVAIVGFVLLFSILAWFLIARSVLVRVIERAQLRSVRPFMLGFISVIAAPVVLGVLMLSVIGSIIGVAGFLLYGVLAIASIVGMTGVIGVIIVSYIQEKRGKKSSLHPYVLVAGTILTVGISLVPIVGPLLLIGVFLLTFGAMIDLVLRPTIE